MSSFWVASMHERHQYPLLILERHLDTFGHVNNATYLEIFEEARWAWITEHGFGLAEIRRLQQGPTILECRLRFQRELRLRERVVVTSATTEYVGRVMHIEQRISRVDDGEVCCDAMFVAGLFDLAERKMILPTPQWLAAVGMTDGWRPKE